MGSGPSEMCVDGSCLGRLWCHDRRIVFDLRPVFQWLGPDRSPRLRDRAQQNPYEDAMAAAWLGTGLAPNFRAPTTIGILCNSSWAATWQGKA